MKRLLIIVLVAFGCSKSNDPTVSFPVPELLGTWQEEYVTTTNCGQYNGTFSGTTNQKWVFTSNKAESGNYKCTYQGVSFEYKLNGDSITVVGFVKTTYSLTNVLLLTGKYTVINQYTGCNYQSRMHK